LVAAGCAACVGGVFDRCVSIGAVRVTRWLAQPVMARANATVRAVRAAAPLRGIFPVA